MEDAHETGMPLYDPRNFRLGPLCKAGHDFHGGQSLIRITSNRCRDCEREAPQRRLKKLRGQREQA